MHKISIVNNYVINSANHNFLKKWLEKNIKDNDNDYFNYVERLECEKNIFFDALVEDNEIVCFAGVLNGGRYPSNHYRMCNRLYMNQLYRTKFSNFFICKNICKSQILENKYLFDVLFISLRKNNKLNMLKKATNIFNFGREWNIENDFFHVAPNGYNKRCFQQIAWTSIKNNNILLENLTREQYEKLDP